MNKLPGKSAEGDHHDEFYYDEEALQQALKALNSLTQGNRLIGVISHVEELRRKLDKQVVVTKAEKSAVRGSTVEIRTE